MKRNKVCDSILIKFLTNKTKMPETKHSPRKNDILQWQETQKTNETKQQTQLDKFFEKAKAEKQNEKKKLTKNMCNLIELEQQLQTAKEDKESWMCEIIWESEINERINELQIQKQELQVELNSQWLTKEELKWLVKIREIWWEAMEQIVNAILPDIEEIPFMLMPVTRELLIGKRLEKLTKVTQEIQKMLEVAEKSGKITKVGIEAIKDWWDQFINWDSKKLKQIIETLLSPTNPKDKYKVWNFLDESRKKVDKLNKSDKPDIKIDKWIKEAAEAKVKRQVEMMREIEEIGHGKLLVRDFTAPLRMFWPLKSKDINSEVFVKFMNWSIEKFVDFTELLKKIWFNNKRIDKYIKDYIEDIEIAINHQLNNKIKFNKIEDVIKYFSSLNNK